MYIYRGFDSFRIHLFGPPLIVEVRTLNLFFSSRILNFYHHYPLMAKKHLHSRSSSQAGVETLLRQGSFGSGKLAMSRTAESWWISIWLCWWKGNWVILFSQFLILILLDVVFWNRISVLVQMICSPLSLSFVSDLTMLLLFRMVGRTFTFQLKLTDFNFSASISLSQSHAYLIPTITDHFLILWIRFVYQLHFIGWVWHTWISYLTVVVFTWRSRQLKRWHVRSWFCFKNSFSWCWVGVDNVVTVNSRGINGVVFDEDVSGDGCERNVNLLFLNCLQRSNVMAKICTVGVHLDRKWCDKYSSHSTFSFEFSENNKSIPATTSVFLIV